MTGRRGRSGNLSFMLLDKRVELRMRCKTLAKYEHKPFQRIGSQGRRLPKAEDHRQESNIEKEDKRAQRRMGLTPSSFDMWDLQSRTCFRYTQTK